MFTRRTVLRWMTLIASGLGMDGVPALGQASREKDGSLRPDTTLWMKRPATLWQDAFPVGNGRLGAMVFGGAKSERIALNDDTLWSGGPRDWNNPGAKRHLPIVRKLVLIDKNYQGADDECRKMEGPWNQNYEPLGDLLIEMEHGEDVASYKRSLDLDTGVMKVEYSVAGIRYVREVFASFPDDVMVVRMTASQAGKVSATLRMKSLLRASASSDASGIVLTGKAPQQSLPQYIGTEPAVVYSDVEGEGMHFASVVHVQAHGGNLQARPDGSMHVAGALSVVMIVGCATGFRGFASMPDMPLEAVVAKARASAERVSQVSYEELSRRHMEDHQKLFHRVSLELPSTPDALLPTDRRVEAFAQNADPSLLVLVLTWGAIC